MMGKIDGTANEITEVKSLATNAKNEAAEASTAVNLLRAEVDTIKKDIIELQGSGDNSSRTRPGKSGSDDEKKRTITFGRFAEDTKSEIHHRDNREADRELQGGHRGQGYLRLRQEICDDEEQRVSRRRRQCGCT